MRLSASRGAKLVVFLAALALLTVACSIQAPDVIFGNPNGAGQNQTQVLGEKLAGPNVAGPNVAGPNVAGPNAGPNVGPNLGGPSAGCLGKATDVGVTGNQIKLGSTFAASGPVSSISGPILKGVQAYFAEVNAAGGVFGRRINLVWKDDGWDAQKGKSLIKELVEQDKVFVMSVVASSNGLDAAKTYLESKRMPVFGSSGLIESQFRSPMQWPVGTSSRSAARIGLLDLKQRGAKNMAIIWLDLLAGAEAREAVREAIKPTFGVNPEDFITSDRSVSLSEADFGPVWTRVKEDTSSWQRAHGKTADGIPDFVTFAIDPTNTIKALQAAQQQGFKPKIGWGGGAPLFLNLVSGTGYAKQTHLLAGTSYFPPLADVIASTAAVASYNNTVHKYFGSSIDLNNPYLEGGYAGAALTVEILKRAGSCLTREKTIAVANNLINFSPAGLTQPLTYTASSHYGNTNGLVVQVQTNGSWKVASSWYKDPTPGK